MIIKFADGSTLDAITVRGQTEHIQGAARDALSFVVPAASISLDKLVNIFSDKNKTKEIYEVDDRGQPVNLIGKNYTIYVSVTNLSQETQGHGDFSMTETENVHIAKIAQVTYQEHLLEQILLGR